MRSTYKFDEFEHFKYRRIEKVVSAVVTDQGVDHWGEEVALDDVAVVELVFQSHNLAHEPECICNKNLLRFCSLNFYNKSSHNIDFRYLIQSSLFYCIPYLLTLWGGGGGDFMFHLDQVIYKWPFIKICNSKNIY